MASFQTDEVRRERYGVLRAQRIKCEKRFSLSGALLAFVTAADIIGSILFSTFGLITTVGAEMLACLPLSLAVYVLMFAGITKRSMMPLLIGALLSAVRVALCPASFFLPTFFPLLIAILTMRKWDALSKEEGFPKFDISFDEREKRAAQMERITKHAAIETGKRRTAAPDADAMSDLLDTEGDVPVATAELSGYHERSRHGRIVESGKAVEYGNMDDL